VDRQVQYDTGRVPVTARGAATRERIVAGAAQEIRLNGAATTLDDVGLRTGTSKSQLFHYFPGGKDQLLLAVAQHEAALVLSDQQPHLSRLTSWAAWDDWRDAVIQHYREQGLQCPLSSLMLQLGRTSLGAQAVVRQLMGEWQDEIASGIRSMQSQGAIAESVDADQAAAALVAGIQGGAMIMIATGELTHLAASLDRAIAQLRESRDSLQP
jgi:AcrR family transcriptional regulator